MLPAPASILVHPASCYYVGPNNAFSSWQVFVCPTTSIIGYQLCCLLMASIGAPMVQATATKSKQKLLYSFSIFI